MYSPIAIAISFSLSSLSSDTLRKPLTYFALSKSDGTPLEDEKTYRVVTNDFVFGGGDGYDFSGATNVSMTIPIRDVLVSAIEKAKTITPKKVDYIKDISK